MFFRPRIADSGRKRAVALARVVTRAKASTKAVCAQRIRPTGEQDVLRDAVVNVCFRAQLQCVETS